MSGQMTGADLEQLEALSTAFRQAGGEFSTKASTLRARIGAAIRSFEGTLDRLTRRVSDLTTAIKTEIGDVAAAAEGVAWTGSNRGGFDGDLAAFREAVVNGAADIDDGIGRLRTQVETRFSPVMAEFGESLQSSAELAEEDTSAMNEAVATQRANLDQAANVGWTSA